MSCFAIHTVLQADDQSTAPMRMLVQRVQRQVGDVQALALASSITPELCLHMVLLANCCHCTIEGSNTPPIGVKKYSQLIH